MEIILISRFLNPEFELLVLIAHLENDPDGQNRLLEMLQKGINWEYLLSLAEYHGMMPLLFLALKDLDQGMIPQSTMSALKTFYFDNTKRNLFLLSQMLTLVKELDAINISAIPFKGPALSKYLFDSYSIRQAGDLDFLVKPKDVRKIIEHLEAKEFKPYYPLSKNQQIALVNISIENHLVLVHPEGKAFIEIHWNFYNSDLVNKKTNTLIWGHLEPVIINDVVLKMLKPEAVLLYLCFHIYKHNWERLFWIWEIDRFINSGIQLDWNWILEHSRFFGESNVLLLSLFVTNQLLGTRLPNEIEHLVLENNQIKKLFDQIVFEPKRNELKVDHKFDTLNPKSRFKVKMSYKNRLKQFLHFAFTPNFFDISSFNLPTQIHFLYFVIRPYRVIARSFLSVFSKKNRIRRFD